MQELLTEHNGGNGAGHHHRRWRRRNIRMLRPILETNRDNLFGQGFVSSGLGSRMRSIEGGRGAISNEVIAKDRLTLLTDPEDFNAPQISASNVANADSGGDAADDEAISSNHIVSLRALNSANRETILPIIPSQVGASNNGELENPTRMNSEQQQFTNQSMRNNLMMMLNPSERRDLPMQDKPLYQYHQNLQQPIQSSWSSTTALLILLICYIIWQCFRGQNKQRKCLDDWPTLLTPSRGGSRSARRGSRQSFDETCELQTVGQPVTTTTATTTTSAASEVANKNRSKNSAILRVKCDNRNDETEVEIIHADGGMPSNCDDGRTTIAKPNNTGIRKSLMRKSLVIAANRAARPRVKLISEKMRRFVDIEAQSDNQATGKVSLANRLVSLLQISGLVKRPLSSNEACSQSTARDAADQETDQKRQDERMTTNVPKALEQQQQQQQAEISPNPDTIEVIIHQNLANSSSSSESLLGFAGSFLEPTINPVAAAADANPKTMESSSGVPLMNRDPSSSRQHNRLPSDSPSNHVITCSNSESNPQISPTTPSSLVNNNKSQLDSPQHELLLGPPCDCALARSKSQTCQSYCQAQVMNRLLTTANTTTSPANIRPCCSVSPSAMSRHENASHQFVQHHQHHHPSAHHHHHPEASLFRPTAAAAAAMGVQNSHCAIYCGNNRAKHHYENYYDDEQEDAYRRLTASIGVQFGLAMEQQNSLMPETQATCSMACHCNSSPTRQSNIIIDGAIGGPLRGDLSLGDSDSGNFSLINNKQRNNSDSICNDSNCSLCQSSLLTTTAPSQQTINMFVGHHPVSLDPIGIGNGPNQQGSPLVSRWHSRRRSALYSRQPRRMSIAGVACQQFATNGYGSGGSGGGNPSTPQHFLHRASIASDGTNGFHQHHHHPAAKQIAYPPAHFCASNKQKSSYSSSAGSSSGIGFSGSQCLNTPTTGAFPYQSFAITKPFTNTDLVANGGCVQAANQSSLVNELQQQQQTTTAAWHLATATAVSTSTGNHQHQVHNCINYKTPALSSSTSRKFSLPVQLECETTSSHHLMMTSSNYQNDLLFFNQQQQQAEHDDDVSTKHSLPSVSPFCRPIQSPNTVSHPIIDGGDSLSSIGVGSLTQKSIEQNRRSSQTITRQSSFWLEDTNLEPAPATLKQTMDNLNTPRHTDVGQPQMIAQECENKTIDPISQERAREFIRPVSSSPELPETPFDEGDEQQQHDKFGPGGASSSTTKSSANRRIQHSSSSSTSSPSPDFHRRHNRQRLSNRTSQSSSITKRRFLKSLKQRRAQRQQSSANSVHRRNGPQASSPLADQKQDTISTDDERDKTKQDDGLSSFDREVANAVSGRTIPDINSTSLERQCRDLWKLRATLHDDALVGDNWSNYHQRLNRRYDSGYKSIENQFSSSIEGNIPSILSLSLHQVSVTNNNENDLHELGRPQSGCSGMIQEQAEESSRNVASSILNEEETQALLDNCDDQQDEQ